MLTLKQVLFWQPRRDILRLFTKHTYGTKLILLLNYLLWPFLFIVCFLHIKTDPNIFWQILTAIVVTEIIERIAKHSFFWKRPLYNRRDQLPQGLVKKWYTGGSFPSGHMVRASYFFFLCLQYHHLDPKLYLVYILPLMFFRVIIGFHYPVDMLGGVAIGFLSWLATRYLVFPHYLVDTFHSIFIFIFRPFI